MFKSRSRKNIKKLTISAPLLQVAAPAKSPVASRSRSAVVVLIAKYAFAADHEQELSLQPKEYMKLLDRPGNGWLKVQRLDRYDEVGFVPASYVSIAVNDGASPITLEWLNATEPAPRSPYFARTAQKTESSPAATPSSSLFDFERSFPTKVSVHKVADWYKIKLTMSDDVVFIGKTLQQIQALHEELSQALVLPLLVPDIQKYMEQLIRVPEIQQSTALLAFINGGDQYRVSVDAVMSDELSAAILDKIAVKSATTPASSSTFYSTEPLPLPQTRPEVSMRRNDDNVKYSSYMYEKNRLVPSSSSNTLGSYTSLIAGYECDEEDEENEQDEQDENEQDEQDEQSDGEQDFDTPKMPSEGFERKPLSPIVNSPETLSESKNSSFSEISTPEESKDSVTPKNSIHSEQESIFSRQGLRSASGSTESSEPSTPSTPMDLEYIWSARAQPNDKKMSLEQRGSAESFSPRSRSLLAFNSVTLEKDAEDSKEDSTEKERNSSSVEPQEARRKHRTAQMTGSPQQFIKIKVALNNTSEDIVALRIKRSNLISVAYLKKLLSYKIYKDYNLTNHYHLEQQTCTGEMEGSSYSDEELLELIRASDKVSLKLVRNREEEA